MTEVKAETGAKHIVKYYVKIVIKSKVIVMVCVIVLKEYCVGESVCVCEYMWLVHCVRMCIKAYEIVQWILCHIIQKSFSCCRNNSVISVDPRSV